MSFATGESLLVRIRIAFGATISADPATWVWTDVTQWWHVDDDVTVTWGRSPGADQAETSQMALTLKNPDARFTAYDGRSPYWPNVKKWTPIQFDIDLGDGAGWRNRFSGFVRKWPLTWPGRSARMALARIEAVGVLSRLGRGKPLDRSPFRRTITAAPTLSKLLGYWPCEDLAGSTQVASAIPGGAPMATSGNLYFAEDTAPPGTTTFDPGQHVSLSRGISTLGIFAPGTKPILNLATAILGQGGSLRFTVPPGTSSPMQWSVCWVSRTNTLQFGAEIEIIEWETPGGSFVKWRLYHQLVGGTTDQVTLFGIDANDVGIVVVSWNASEITFTDYRVEAIATGVGLTTVRLWVGGIKRAEIVNGIFTLARITGGTVNPLAIRVTGTSGFPFGHLQVWDTATPPSLSGGGDWVAGITDSYGGTVWPFWRHLNETAHDRLARLSTQDSVATAVPVTNPGTVTRMGPQPDGVSLDLYRQSEAADQGLSYESGFGLGYLPRGNRYNPPVALTVDAALGQLAMPFEPVDDDQLLRNIWTVERADGSSATAVDQESVDSQGEIEASATGLNLAQDASLQGHADWRLHQSTVEEPRYPALSLNVGAHRELAAAWVACRPGSRVQVINPPAQNVPGTIDQLLVGATETYRGRRSWHATLNVQPASPWRIAKVGAGARVGSKTAAVASPATSGATDLYVADPGGPWTTNALYPADFPFDANANGERITVGTIASALVDTFTRTSPSTWTTATSGQTWTNTGGAPTDHTVSGGTGRMSISARAVQFAAEIAGSFASWDTYGTVTFPATPTGDVAEVGVVVRRVDGSNFVDMRLFMLTDGSVLAIIRQVVAGVETASGFVSVPGVTATSAIRWRIQAFGPTLRVKAWLASATEPGPWLATLTVTMQSAGGLFLYAQVPNTNTNPLSLVVQWDNVEVIVPQKWAVTRSVNGTVKAHNPGAPVRLWTPYVVGL